MSEERILDFLDGRLSGSAEEELLHTLAVSPERRQMLRDHLRLRELTSTLSRQEKFAVPEHVSQQLFTKLTALGFAAPPTTAAILTRATDYVKRDKPAERRSPVFWTGRRIVGTMAMASVVSFLLGVSAFYVFGERMGLHTLSEQRSASIVKTPRTIAPVLHQQYASAAVNIEQPLSIARVERVRAASQPMLTASLGPIAARDMSAGFDLTKTHAHVAPTLATPGAIDGPIVYTAPIQPDENFNYQPSSGDAKFLRNPGLNFDPFNPLPFLSEKGTISFRFGAGRLPIKNTTPQWSSLSELKFTWALGKFGTARASLGQLMTWEREAQGPPQTNVITTTPAFKMIPVAGLELGLALDQYGIPVEISAGAMADGAVKFYPRAGLFGHYDLLPSLSLGVGIEGLVYKHDVTSSVLELKKTFKDAKPIVDPQSVTSESSGFVGLSFELGWHF